MELGELLLNGKNRVEIIPADAACAKINADYYGADGQTTFGMLITQSGGVVVNGAVRLLGSNQDPNFRDICLFNVKHGSAGLVFIGDDIFGGIFAVNTGLFSPDNLGSIMYLAPDTLEWEDTELQLSGLFAWLKDGDMAGFYGQFSEEEYNALCARNVGFNKVLSFYPPQWSAEFSNGERDVREIDVNEHYRLCFQADPPQAE